MDVRHAALLWGLATFLAAARSGDRLVARRLGAPPRPPPSGRAWLLGGVVVAGVVLPFLGPRPLAWSGLAGVLIVGVRRLLVTSRRRTDGERRSSQVLEVCEALSAELRSGLPAPVALSRACATWPDLSPVVSAAELGGDVVQALRDLARVPGADGLRALAAAWVVAGQSGASLAVVVDRVAEGLRHDDAARREVAASLGPPRATARMLAVLPVFGVGLGLAIGADPLHFLLATTAGSACLVGGAGLAIGGLLWVERLASAVEGSGRPLPMAER